eukprot:m51a1_g562 hypothetical protein (530) ;mRNA; r:497655-499961
MLLLRVHDCTRAQSDAHVRQALVQIHTDCESTNALLDRVENKRFFANATLGKKVDTCVRDIVSDGMALATAVAMASLSLGQQATVDAALERCRDLVASSAQKLRKSSADLGAAGEGVQGVAPATDMLSASVLDQSIGLPDDEIAEAKEAEEREKQRAEAAAAALAQQASPPPMEMLGEDDLLSYRGEEGRRKSKERHSGRLSKSKSRRSLERTREDPCQTDSTSAATAAEVGYGPAQYQVAVMLVNGIGTRQDCEAAVLWYTKAAEQGVVDALYALGLLFLEGKYVERDIATSAVYFDEASQVGHVESMYQTGALYERGAPEAGIERDDVEALRWYEMAASRGNAAAQCALGAMLQLGREQERAWELLDGVAAAAAELSSTGAPGEALLAMADIAEASGRPSEALGLLQSAAREGNARSAARLAALLWSGCPSAGAARDPATALALLRSAAELGDEQAAADLGGLLLEAAVSARGQGMDSGVTEALADAVSWLKKAASAGDKRSLASLAQLGPLVAEMESSEQHQGGTR